MNRTEKKDNIPLWRLAAARYIVIWTVPVALMALVGFYVFVLFTRGNLPRPDRAHVSDMQFTLFVVESVAMALAWLPFPMNIWAIGMLRSVEDRQRRLLSRVSYIYISLYAAYLSLWVLAIFDFCGLAK